MSVDTGVRQIGFIGLGVMGQSLTLNLVDHGYLVAGYDRDQSKRQQWQQREETECVVRHGESRIQVCSDLKQLLAALPAPRIIIVMVPAGQAVDEVCQQLLLAGLSAEDIVVDCGNSHWQDTARREVELKGRCRFFTTAVSGGEAGARIGPSLMPSGDPEAWQRLQPVWEAIAAKVDEQGRPVANTPGEKRPGVAACTAYLGSGGAGHYVKMVHNGIEYADMQLICEAYWLLRQTLGYTPERIGEVFSRWNQGRLNSYLMEISADILKHRDIRTGKPMVDVILDKAGQNGTGRWTAINATEIGTPAGMISEAVYARALSALQAQRQQASPLLAPNTLSCPIAPEQIERALENALYSAKICAYAQGFQTLNMAQNAFGWRLNFADIARIWRGGCIIRATFLQSVVAAFERAPTLDNLLLDDDFADRLNQNVASLREIVSVAARTGVAMPAMFSALAYYDGYRTVPSAISLLQAQRDYFGAHSYQRTDAQEQQRFHTHWQDAERSEKLL